MAQLGSKDAKIPYLDGLRAYSILVVVLGHTLWSNSWLQPKWYLQIFLTDALLGVRVFFVISGFLITTLLLNEEDVNGHISIRGFYERRVARIFPAFYLYIGIIAVLAALHIMSVPWGSFAAASTFTYNFTALWSHGGPIDKSAVLGHVWTLSVEEQFYLFWPSCLVFLGRRRSWRIAAAAVILLPLIRLGAFFLLHPSSLRGTILQRMSQDQIMWGVLAAFAVRHGVLDRMCTHRFRIAYPWIAGVVLFGLCPMIDRTTQIGLGSYLVPTLQCLATLLLIFWLLSGEGGLLRRALETWPAVQLGLLSYSLYLWQQPFTQWSGLSWLNFPWNALLPLVAAIVSYRLVEVPMRRRIRRWFSQPKAAH